MRTVWHVISDIRKRRKLNPIASRCDHGLTHYERSFATRTSRRSSCHWPVLRYRSVPLHRYDVRTGVKLIRKALSWIWRTPCWFSRAQQRIWRTRMNLILVPIFKILVVFAHRFACHAASIHRRRWKFLLFPMFQLTWIRALPVDFPKDKCTYSQSCSDGHRRPILWRCKSNLAAAHRGRRHLVVGG